MRNLILALLISSSYTLSYSQDKSLTLKKGEALDLLLLTTNPDAQDELKEYFSKAVPVAQKWGYQPQYSSTITSPPTQGNYWPKTFLLATWENYEKRIEFTKEIVELYPQFHSRRRLIWPTFDLTYWKVDKEAKLVFNANKTYVATSYWSLESKDFASFKKAWLKEVKKQGGKMMLELTNGTSPFGYYYNPELFVITEWSTMEDFTNFLESNRLLDHKGVKHVNQFILN